MNVKAFLCSIAVVFFVPFASDIFAQQGEVNVKTDASTNKIIPAENAEYIDVDNNRIINETDIRQQWKYKNCPVKTPEETKYDIDRDGWLEPEESREALKQHYDDIKFGRGMGVDMDILREYDADGNGSIDPREAQYIKEDTSY